MRRKVVRRVQPRRVRGVEGSSRRARRGGMRWGRWGGVVVVWERGV